MKRKDFFVGGRQMVQLKEVEYLLPFSWNTIRCYAVKGIIPVTKLGGHYYANPEEIREWMKNNTTKKGGAK